MRTATCTRSLSRLFLGTTGSSPPYLLGNQPCGCFRAGPSAVSHDSRAFHRYRVRCLNLAVGPVTLVHFPPSGSFTPIASATVASTCRSCLLFKASAVSSAIFVCPASELACRHLCRHTVLLPTVTGVQETALQLALRNRSGLNLYPLGCWALQGFPLVRSFSFTSERLPALRFNGLQALLSA